MSNFTKVSRRLIACTAVSLVASNASAAILSTTADALVTENSPNADGSAAVSGGNSTGTVIALRQNYGSTTPNRNEIGVFKFNFAGIDKANVSAVTFNAYMHRGNSNNSGKNLALAILPFGSAGADWTEAGITFDTMPGLVFDGNSVSTGMENLTSLGNVQLPASPAYDTEGTLVPISLPASFISAVQASGANDLVTLYIGYAASSNGTWNVTSKEAGTYASGTSFDVGTRAAFLDVTVGVIPEPTSIAAIAFAGAALRRRRRA
jgi:hypothetical protein